MHLQETGARLSPQAFKHPEEKFLLRQLKTRDYQAGLELAQPLKVLTVI
jgi:hypothetical protein